MLTFFTTPKAFAGHFDVIQRNALRSWKELGAEFSVIVFGNDPGVDQACADLGLRHQPIVARNEYGTPLLNDLFAQAQAMSATPYLCYINADILLMSDFRDALRRLVQKKKRFLMVGHRTLLDLPVPVNFAGEWEPPLRSKTQQEGKLDRPTAIDYFVFRRGMYERIPPFAVGRTSFDNWLIFRARELQIPVVDATPCVLAVHQNHDYSHAGRDPSHRGHKWIWHGPEAKHNFDLAGGMKCSFTLWDASHTLTPEGLKPRDTHQGLGGGIWSYRRSVRAAG